MYDGFDDAEVHVLRLHPESSAASKPQLVIPQAPSSGLRRIVLALWGDVFDEDLPYWRERYEPIDATGEALFPALLAAQVGQATSPLALGRRHMNEGLGHRAWPTLYVLPRRPGFNALLAFWNMRARTFALVPGMPVVGIAHEALQHPEHLRPLRRWVETGAGSLRPDLMVVAASGVRERVDSALNAAGFERDLSRRQTRMFGAGSERPPRPTFGYGEPGIREHFLRGALGRSLVAFADGRSSLSLPQPSDLNIRSGHTVRLVLHDLPLPLPLTEPMARILHQHATARDGVLIQIGSFGEWNLDVRLPNRREAIAAWAAGHGLAERQTQDGRYAESLLERLGNLDGLNALAAEVPVRVLEQLATTSQGRPQSRTPGELAGHGITRTAVLSALGPLINAGYVVRGHSLRCPRCNFALWFGLDELAEQVRCDACRAFFTLPVTTQGRPREPSIEYRLDGLTARAMEQHVLPVLLAVRAARRLFDGYLFSAWPGVELSASGEPGTDVDLLAYDPWLLCCEVKHHAGGLGRSQFRKLLRLCDRVGGRPGLAALEGTFDGRFEREVRGRAGHVFHRAELLSR
jgi:hypothetical protein